MNITSINKTHQSYVNKAYKHLRKYHDLVNLVNDCSNDKEILRLENKQATQFDLYEDALYMLPIREQANFAKQHKIIHGYT